MVMLSSSSCAVLDVVDVDVPSTCDVAAEKRDDDDHRGELDDIDEGVYAAAYCVAESSTVAWRRRRAATVILPSSFLLQNENARRRDTTSTSYQAREAVPALR